MLKKIALSVLFAITFTVGIGAAGSAQAHAGKTHHLCPQASCTGQS
ncbi:MAG TPA: hypothetical protein VHM31_11645 [Polyangia bacterium]|nr:hypothetical protein [Polyangia bacterium]